MMLGAASHKPMSKAMRTDAVLAGEKCSMAEAIPSLSRPYLEQDRIALQTQSFSRSLFERWRSFRGLARNETSGVFGLLYRLGLGTNGCDHVANNFHAH